MTEDRDFKQIVRERAAKTGESYQTARRMLEGKRGRFSARVKAMFATPSGLVLGCVMEEGTVTRGMQVTVATAEGVEHHGTVVSLRHMWTDLDTVAAGAGMEFGLLVDPAYNGTIPAQVTG
jgi:translation initiation factor IF-2